MLYHRVIPVSVFRRRRDLSQPAVSSHYRLGDPLQQLERYKAWDVDEIVYLDMHRTANGQRLLDILPEVGRNCFAPLAVGGGIRSIEDIHRHLEAGADRVVINTAAVETPAFITDAAYRYGEQAIIVSIDARRRADGSYEVVVEAAAGRPDCLPPIGPPTPLLMAPEKSSSIRSIVTAWAPGTILSC